MIKMAIIIGSGAFIGANITRWVGRIITPSIPSRILLLYSEIETFFDSSSNIIIIYNIDSFITTQYNISSNIVGIVDVCSNITLAVDMCSDI